MYKAANARLVPKYLSLLQKRRRIELAKEMLDKIDENPTLIKRIITSDETWVYEYHVFQNWPETEETSKCSFVVWTVRVKIYQYF